LEKNRCDTNFRRKGVSKPGGTEGKGFRKKLFKGGVEKKRFRNRQRGARLNPKNSNRSRCQIPSPLLKKKKGAAGKRKYTWEGGERTVSTLGPKWGTKLNRKKKDWKQKDLTSRLAARRMEKRGVQCRNSAVAKRLNGHGAQQRGGKGIFRKVRSL